MKKLSILLLFVFMIANVYSGDFTSKLTEWNNQNIEYKEMTKHLVNEENTGPEIELEISSDRIVLIEMTNDMIDEVLKSKTLEECKAFVTYSKICKDDLTPLKVKVAQALKSSLAVSETEITKQKLQLINGVSESVLEHYSQRPHYHIGGPNGPIVWGSWGPNAPHHPPTHNPPTYNPPTYNPQPYNPPTYNPQPTYPTYNHNQTKAYRDGYNKGIGSGREDRRNGVYFRPEYFGFSLIFQSDRYKRNYKRGYREGYRRGYYGYRTKNNKVNLYYRMNVNTTRPSVSIPRTNSRNVYPYR
ncbi:hypothetical protein KAJ27_10970 [bacterium]|nr:hypothetical protein [bacterium]